MTLNSELYFFMLEVYENIFSFAVIEYLYNAVHNYYHCTSIYWISTGNIVLWQTIIIG